MSLKLAKIFSRQEQKKSFERWNNHAGPVDGDNIYITESSKHKRRTFWAYLLSFHSIQNQNKSLLNGKTKRQCDLFAWTDGEEELLLNMTLHYKLMKAQENSRKKQHIATIVMVSSA